MNDRTTKLLLAAIALGLAANVAVPFVRPAAVAAAAGTAFRCTGDINEASWTGHDVQRWAVDLSCR